jgi:hypothetical protein
MERAFVLLGGVIFVLLSVAVAILLFRNDDGLESWEELLAFAGYLIGAVGFREVLGVSRVAGVSAFEVAVFGAPMMVLATGMMVGFWRNFRRGSVRRDAFADRLTYHSVEKASTTDD